MGGEDKGLVEVAGRPMVAHTIDALRPQSAEVIVNANRNAGAYRAATGCRVIADTVGGFAGPLAGMASALEASDDPAAAHCTVRFAARRPRSSDHGCMRR